MKYPVNNKPLRFGVMIHDFEEEYTLPIVHGVFDFCSEHSIECMVFVVRGDEGHHAPYDYQYGPIVQYFTQENLDGLLILTNCQCQFMTREDFERTLEAYRPIPMVSIGAELKTTSNVVVTDSEAFEEMVRHVIDVHKRKRPLLVSTNSKSPDIMAREAAYHKVLAEYGIPDTEDFVLRPVYNLSQLDKLMQRYKSRADINFDAIICFDDKMAFGCCNFLSKIDVSVPYEVIVTGFDDTLTAKMCKPTLTSISQKVEDQGYYAAEIAYKHIMDPDMPLKTERIPALPLYRQSCGCLTHTDFLYNAITSVGKKVPLLKNIFLQEEVKYHQVREEIFLLQNFTQAVQTDMSPTSFKHVLIEHLRKFSVGACAICLFPQPLFNDSETGCVLPDEARLFVAYNSEKEWLFDDEPLKINPYKNIVPEDLFPRECTYRVVLPLFSQQQLYGYAYFTPGTIDSSFYSILFSMITNQVASAFALQNEKREAEALRTVSYMDDLAKTFNRRGFFFYGKHAIEMALEMNQVGMVFFGDLDNLKAINDTYGHAAGNRAIQAQAEILKKAFRSSDVIGRIGGDEFCAVSVGMQDDSVETVREKIRQITDSWNEESGEDFTVSMSIGGVPFSKESFNLSELLSLADAEQYKEKRQKKRQKSE
ncbi:MAG: GGDEF domain-containing protein [Treponemataceae bacterium]|nr:GGDEF domain-containing protein [Treponemataceae bacterium]